jgi:hypothetical protein
MTDDHTGAILVLVWRSVTSREDGGGRTTPN